MFREAPRKCQIIKVTCDSNKSPPAEKPTWCELFEFRSLSTCTGNYLKEPVSTFRSLAIVAVSQLGGARSRDGFNPSAEELRNGSVWAKRELSHRSGGNVGRK